MNLLTYLGKPSIKLIDKSFTIQIELHGFLKH